MNSTVTWVGTEPKNCDICHEPLTRCFYDGKTTMGPWATMCSSCFSRFGYGLGVGKGQKYDLVTLRKVEG